MAKKKQETDSSKEEQLRKNPINVFNCDQCPNCDTMKFEDFKNHLFNVHGLKPEDVKGKKQMTMHMDGSYWFSSTYKWTLENGLTFTQFVEMARSKGDMMRY